MPEAAMRRCSGSLLLVVLLLSCAISIPRANAQVDRITLAAGTDEDHALQAISSEQDLQKTLDYGDKALAGSPHNLDILVSQATVAQQAKNNVRLMIYAARGGEVCLAIAKQAKPEGMSDEDFARKVNEDKSSVQNSCDFLESSGFNAITSETDPKSRMAEIEKFTPAFPDSKFQEQVSNY